MTCQYVERVIFDLVGIFYFVSVHAPVQQLCAPYTYMMFIEQIISSEEKATLLHDKLSQVHINSWCAE